MRVSHVVFILYWVKSVYNHTSQATSVILCYRQQRAGRTSTSIQVKLTDSISLKSLRSLLGVCDLHRSNSKASGCAAGAPPERLCAQPTCVTAARTSWNDSKRLPNIEQAESDQYNDVESTVWRGELPHHGASDIVKAESSGEDPRATGGLVSNLPHPRVNKTKQHWKQMQRSILLAKVENNASHALLR